MDFASQKSYDHVLQYLVITSAALALCVGYFTWSLKRMIVTYAIGVFLVMLVIVPDWPYFTERHFTEWTEPMASDKESRLLQKARFSVLMKTTKYAKRDDIHLIGILFVIASMSCCIYYTWKFIWI